MNVVSSRTLAATLMVSLLGSGCSTLPTVPAQAQASPSPSLPDTELAVNAETPPEADRAAILAMLGEYRISFAFDETVTLQDDYQRAEPHRSGGNEVVVLIEDAGDRIVLQHLLVGNGGHVTKHWRQDWHYQASQRLEFVEEQTWELREIDANRVPGSWTQCVYEVSDAPRYCGTGRWNHRYGVATWTSDRSWRPLPRREYTKRSDYNALNVENRHTITPSGWTHEQDNTKVIREGERTVATISREFGFNDYRHSDDFDFAPAYRYWTLTADYWARVRTHWQQAFDSGRVQLNMPVDGMPLISALFEHAAAIQTGEQVSNAAIAAAFTEHVRHGDAATATASVHGGDVVLAHASTEPAQ